MQWGTLALGIVAAVYFFDDLKAAFTPANLTQTRANLIMGKAERAPGFSGEVPDIHGRYWRHHRCAHL